MANRKFVEHVCIAIRQVGDNEIVVYQTFDDLVSDLAGVINLVRPLDVVAERLEYLAHQVTENLTALKSLSVASPKLGHNEAALLRQGADCVSVCRIRSH